MNFDRENNQTPRVNSLSEQDFSVPRQGFYASETQQFSNFEEENTNFESNFESAQEVNPFVPPQFEQIETPEQQVSNEQAFEEREIVNWQAPDMIIGEKSKRWYAVFFVVVAVLVGVALWFQLWSFAVLIAVASVAIMMTRRDSHRNLISYSLSTRGIYIGNVFHPYDEFKHFGIIQESQIYSIVFVPKRRFAPSTSIYFDKQNGEKITDIIGQRLPMEQLHLDLIDRIIRKINL